MWQAIKNVLERHNLLKKLSARRKLYTATKEESEKVLKYSNRIRQLACTLRSMNVLIAEIEMAMVFFNGLPDEYRALISAIDAIDSEGRELSWEYIKARLLQDEKRIKMRA